MVFSEVAPGMKTVLSEVVKSMKTSMEKVGEGCKDEKKEGLGLDPAFTALTGVKSEARVRLSNLSSI